jgi:RNA 2',3'-cyclic 3'-phosphodiesterase
VRETLSLQLEPYRRAAPDARWTPPDSWHLTLLFLGAVGPDRSADLASLIDSVSATMRGPYHVEADRGDGRVRRGDGVAWLGLGRGAGTLIALAGRLEAACPAFTIPGAQPKRTPSAHVTVARRADRALVTALRTQALGALGADWTVDRVSLMRSHLDAGGARYETLHERAL